MSHRFVLFHREIVNTCVEAKHCTLIVFRLLCTNRLIFHLIWTAQPKWGAQFQSSENFVFPISPFTRTRLCPRNRISDFLLLFAVWHIFLCLSAGQSACLATRFYAAILYPHKNRRAILWSSCSIFHSKYVRIKLWNYKKERNFPATCTGKFLSFCLFFKLFFEFHFSLM